MASKKCTRGIASGFNELANVASGYLPMVRKEFTSTAGAINQTVRSFSAFLQEGRTQQQVGQVLANNTAIVREFGSAGISGTRIILDLLEAAGPLLIQISRDMSAFFERLASSTSMNTTGLSEFFESTYTVLRKTIKVVSDFSAALYNIASVGVPLGSAMGDSFLQMAENFRAFTESEEGINKIREWFVEMTPVVYELGYLLRDVSKALFGIGGNGDSFIVISQALRQELLPVIVDFIEKVSDNLIPTILELIKVIAEFFTEIDPLRFIIPILAAIAGAFKAVTVVLDAMGGAAKFVVGAIVAMMFTVKAAIVVLNLLRVAKLRAALAARTLGTSIRTMMISAGAVGALLTVLGTVLISTRSSTEEVAASNKEWAKSLFDVNGALADNARLLAAEKLEQEGVLDAARQAGVNTYDLVTAYLEGGDAINKYIDALRGYGEENATTADKFQASWTHALDPRNWLQPPHTRKRALEEAIPSGDASTRLEELSDGLSGAKESLYNVQLAAGAAGNGMDYFADQTERTKTAADRLNDAMKTLDALLEKRATKRAYFESLEGLRDILAENGDNFDILTRQGRETEAALDKVFSDAFQRADQAIEAGNLPKALKILETSEQDIRDIFVNAFGEDEGNRLADNALGPLLDEIEIVKRELNILSNQQWKVRITTELAGAGALPGQQTPTSRLNIPPSMRFAGGPIVGGRSYMVGELGPEAFVGRNGDVSMIGANGPEITRFPQGGYVVPNHVLHGKQDSSVPSNVMSALAGAVSSRSSSNSSGEYQIGDRAINVHIGNIQQASEFDVAKAVKKGILEAERNRRERS